VQYTFGNRLWLQLGWDEMGFGEATDAEVLGRVKGVCGGILVLKAEKLGIAGTVAISLKCSVDNTPLIDCLFKSTQIKV